MRVEAGDPDLATNHPDPSRLVPSRGGTSIAWRRPASNLQAEATPKTSETLLKWTNPIRTRYETLAIVAAVFYLVRHNHEPDCPHGRIRKRQKFPPIVRPGASGRRTTPACRPIRPGVPLSRVLKDFA